MLIVSFDTMRKRMNKRLFMLEFVLIVALVGAIDSYGKPNPENGQGETHFDISRAWIPDSLAIEPFYVKETRLLSEALARGALTENTSILVVEHEAGKLALLTLQLVHHHVAQGEIAGQPWMVSF